MIGTVTLDGERYEILHVELHVPQIEESRYLYLTVQTHPVVGGFNLFGVELPLLETLEDLDGKRLHVQPTGETYDDDTLGTDIIGADISGDINFWYSNGEDYKTYQYGDIQIDFERIEGRRFRCRVACTLTLDDEEPRDLPAEAFASRGQADFVVTVDEKDLYNG